MINEEYAQHIIQKHRLSIAIAVIKTKPANLTYDEYIDLIKKEINEKNMEFNVDVSICDDDFDISDDNSNIGDDIIRNDGDKTIGEDQSNTSQNSFNILTNNGLNDFHDPLEEKSDADSLLGIMTQLSNIEDNCANEVSINDFTQTTNVDESQVSVNDFENKINETADSSMTFCESYTQNNDKLDNEVTKRTNANLTNIKRCISNNIVDRITENDNCTSKNICKDRMNNLDSQQTVLYTLQGFTNNTHFSQSQEDLIVSKKYLLNKPKVIFNNNTCNQNINENIKKYSNHNEIVDKNILNRNKELINNDVDVSLNKLKNVYTENDFKNVHAHDINVLDNITIYFNEKDNVRKNKNVPSDKVNECKRLKIDTNDKICNQNSSNRLEFEGFGQTSKDQTKTNSLEIDLTNSAMFSQSNEEVDDFSTIYSQIDKITCENSPTFSLNSAHLNQNNVINGIYKTNIAQGEVYTETVDLTQYFVTQKHMNELTPNESNDYNTKDGLRSENKPKAPTKIINRTETQFSFAEDQSLLLTNNVVKNINSPFGYIKNGQKYLQSTNTRCCNTIINITKDKQTTYSSPNIKNVAEYEKENIMDIKRKELLTNNNKRESIDALKDCNEKTNIKQETFKDTFKENKWLITKEAILDENQTKEAIFNDNTPENIQKDAISDDNSPENIQKEAISNNNTPENIQKEAISNDNTPDNIQKDAISDDNTLENMQKEAISNDNTLENMQKEAISNDNTPKNIHIESCFSIKEKNAQSETMSFKILEDLNRIKSYLNRIENRSSEGVHDSLDSGFRSSQQRSSYKSASQLSEVWLNESAHSLLTFIAVSQLSDKTAEIADEISTILGKLIDKLHEQEIYPNFLDVVLEKVKMSLNEVYERNNKEFNDLLKIDTTIYRILLLNRSRHIIHYTMEKIIIILEKTHSELGGDIYELRDIDKTENVCYIFHILEVILKRLKKTNEFTKSRVQNSQEDDRVLRKSSLTEIWRRKWNFSKEEVFAGSSKKNCVPAKCSDVLNRIIIQAMDGYSLVAYAALQCYNLLQN